MPAADPRETIRDLGFDPDLVQAVVLTTSTAVAIAADYPEPHTPPTQETR